MILVMAFFLITYTFHSTWVTSEAYSSPSIVLSARGGDGSRIIFDDFREAYYWLRHNTPEVEDARNSQAIHTEGSSFCLLTNVRLLLLGRATVGLLLTYVSNMVALKSGTSIVCDRPRWI